MKTVMKFMANMAASNTANNARIESLETKIDNLAAALMAASMHPPHNIQVQQPSVASQMTMPTTASTPTPPHQKAYHQTPQHHHQQYPPPNKHMQGHGGWGGCGRGRGQGERCGGNIGSTFKGLFNTPNPIKRFENTFYCYSHGFDVDHDGCHCTDQMLGHLPCLTANMKRVDMEMPEHQQQFVYASYKAAHKKS